MGVSVYNKIKKQNGERFAKTIRNYHNGILEIPDIDVILRHAGRDAEPLMSYLMSLLAVNDDIPAAGNPFDLLKQAGYNAFTADTLKKQNSIKNYFAKGELLCTFGDAARHKKFHIVHAIKEGADKIQRADFNGRESRQDEYGTSVISIQMMKKGGFISIKNRYNHAVDNCDNTFNSNPDNIIQGLSTALKDHFNVDFSASKIAMPEGYALFNKQIFEYHTEDNNIYYGDGAWVDEGEIKTVNKSAGDAMFDGFIFDNKTKTLKKIANGLDNFADDFNRYYGGNKGLYVKDGNLMLGNDVLIGAEKSRIKTLYLPELLTVGNYFLVHAYALTHFKANSLTVVGDNFLNNAPALIDIEANSLTKVGDNFLFNVTALTHFKSNSLIIAGDNFLRFAPLLIYFEANSLTTTGHGFLRDTHVLKYFKANSLIKTGHDFLRYPSELRHFEANSLTITGDNFLYLADVLIHFEANNLIKAGSNFLYDAPALKHLNAPELINIDLGSFANSLSLEVINIPPVKNLPNYILLKMRLDANPPSLPSLG